MTPEEGITVLRNVGTYSLSSGELHTIILADVHFNL
jgi:hypothetical protein